MFSRGSGSPIDSFFAAGPLCASAAGRPGITFAHVVSCTPQIAFGVPRWIPKNRNQLDQTRPMNLQRLQSLHPCRGV